MSKNAIVWMLGIELAIFVVGLASPVIGRLFAGASADRRLEGEDRRSLALTRIGA